MILAVLVLLPSLSLRSSRTDDVLGHSTARIIASTLLHGKGWAQPLTQGSDGVQSGLFWRYLPVCGQPLRNEHAQRTGVNREAQWRLESDRLAVYPGLHPLAEGTHLQAL